MILAGDVGGTNVRLALFDRDGARLVRREEARYRSRELSGLEAALDLFLPGKPSVEAAGFGVAGPVRGGRSETTNLPWIVDGESLAARLGLPRVGLVNDLVANALGLGDLPPPDLAVVNEGEEDPEGNRALISPGTGLGEAYLVRTKGGWLACPSEGGHASFSPRDSHEIELLRHLQARYGHVSCERVVSGPGLADLYRFERDRSGILEPAWLTAEIGRRGDVAAAVSAAALAGTDPVAGRTLERWLTIWGGESGNLALKILATGGVFLGGGIAPKILPKLVDGTFLRAFCDKGRFAPRLERVPIRVVLNEDCALMGAARAALPNPSE